MEAMDVIEIICTILTGVFTLTGVFITTRESQQKFQNELKQEFKISQAVTNTKIEMLTDEVKKHNDFATQIPTIKTELKDVIRRVDILEAARKD